MSRTLQVAILAALIVVLLFWGATQVPIGQYGLARALYAYDPSAERAYEYGSQHFSVADPAAYNIDYAEYFYRQVLVQDPNFPAAHHQLARIFFLRGQFFSALEEADQEIARAGDAHPHAYYVRGLIRGYQGDYQNAAKDFRYFLSLVPEHWAAMNDLSWVLMRDGRYDEAVRLLEGAVARYPENAWLLNSYAVALYEEARYREAEEIAARALRAISQLSSEDWSAANPGNDARIASTGLETFRTAAVRNLERIAHEASQGAVQ